MVLNTPGYECRRQWVRGVFDIKSNDASVRRRSRLIVTLGLFMLALALLFVPMVLLGSSSISGIASVGMGIVAYCVVIFLARQGKDTLAGWLLIYDALSTTFRKVRVKRDPGCALCGDHPTIRDLSLHTNVAGPVCVG